MQRKPNDTLRGLLPSEKWKQIVGIMKQITQMEEGQEQALKRAYFAGCYHTMDFIGHTSTLSEESGSAQNMKLMNDIDNYYRNEKPVGFPFPTKGNA